MAAKSKIAKNGFTSAEQRILWKALVLYYYGVPSHNPKLADEIEAVAARIGQPFSDTVRAERVALGA